MAPFFDALQIHDALRNEALPELQRLADDSDLRERIVGRRFERNDPPPYEESSESTNEVESTLPPDEVDMLLDPPLNGHELDHIAWRLRSLGRTYTPGEQYNAEASIEAVRVHNLAINYHSSAQVKRWLNTRQDQTGDERQKIITRRNIKRRWQKLGIWNPQWGIPGRTNNPQPSDDPSKWRWAWEDSHPVPKWRIGSEGEEVEINLDHPIARTLKSRQGLRRGEHRPLPPQSRVQAHTSASEAESFITSRPWFIFRVECDEEEARFGRLSGPAKRAHLDQSTKPLIIERWKRRGDWKKEWDDIQKSRPGWRWRNESPSPEPEDLTPLHTLDMEFTPSEVDALEDISPNEMPLGDFISGQESCPSAPSQDSTSHADQGLISTPLPQPLGAPLERPAKKLKGLAPAQPLSTVPKQRKPHDLDDQSTTPPRRSDRIAAMRAKQVAAQPLMPSPPKEEHPTNRKPVPARPPKIKSGKPKKESPKFSDKSGITKYKAKGNTAAQKQPKGRGHTSKAPLPPTEQPSQPAQPVPARPLEAAPAGKRKRGRPRKAEDVGASTSVAMDRSGPGEIVPVGKQPRVRGRPPKKSTSGVSKSTASSSTAQRRTGGR